MRRKLEVASLHTARYAEKFRYLSPSGKLKSMRQQLADYEEQIPKAMHQRLEQEHLYALFLYLISGKIFAT